jgi:RNA polymerase sigma factor (sigma-70 family)
MDELLTSVEQYRSVTRRLPRLTREQEADLVQRARIGDPFAREELITSCLNYIGFIANWYARYVHHDDYLDLVGIGNLTVVENLDRALTKDNPCAYLRKTVKTVVINYCITHASLVTRPTYGKPTYTQSLNTPVYSNTLTQEPVVVQESPVYSWLYQALERLPKRDREVLTRHYGLYNSPVESLYEMSRRMSRSVKGSIAYLTEYRALRRLRKLLAQQEGKAVLHG